MRKKKLLKVFTRDFSLIISEWWRLVLKKNFERDFGVGFSDNACVSNGQTVSYFSLNDDLAKTKRAILHKLQSDPNYYISNSQIYRREIDKTKKILEKITSKTEINSKLISLLKSRFSALYPMLRLSNYSVWADNLKKNLSKKSFGIITSRAYQDRLYAEGVFEAIDSVIRKLSAKKLEKLEYPIQWSKFLSVDELEKIVVDSEFKLNRQILEQRTHRYTYCKGKIYPGNDYHGIFNLCGYYYQEEKTQNDLIKGNVTFKANKLKGKVRLIYSLDQLSNFEEGEILVTPMTVPDFMSAIKKAKAIITDEGGITCHAAIVSRELGIPCIIGTKIATKVLKDGDLVEVDAGRGIVKKLK